MPTDHVALHRVAWLTLVTLGCGPAVRPLGPSGEPGSIAPLRSRSTKAVGGRQVLLGEMCPQGAAGRPAVAPLIMRSSEWTDNPAEVAASVERGSVPRMVVYGTDGKQAGVFDTVGVADVGLKGLHHDVAVGTYVGASPCSAEASKGERLDDPRCTEATGGCGLAIGELARPDDSPTTPTFATGGVCLSGDTIAIDIDGDGVSEAFPLATILDGVRGPTEEWTAAPTAGAACTPTFQIYGLKLVRPPEPGKSIDPKSIVVLDVLGVVDLDGDGRNEVVIALRFPTVRTILVYRAVGSPQRLELTGEGESFPQ